jgi:hypothetical protein
LAKNSSKTLSYPIAISAEELAEFYYFKNPEFNRDMEYYKQSIDLAVGDGIFCLYNVLYLFYLDIVCFYIYEKFCQGNISIIHNGNDFIRLAKKDKIIRDLLKELKIDLSHLYGNFDSDVQMLIIPFSDIDDALYFEYILRKKYLVFCHSNGYLKSKNLPLKPTEKNPPTCISLHDMLVFGEIFNLFDFRVKLEEF